MISFQKKETVSKLQTAYSIVSQGANKALLDWGNIADWDLSLSTKDYGQKYIKPYFSFVKECTEMSDGCWVTDGFNGYYDLAGNKITESVPYSLVLNNGMILGINKINGTNILSYIVDINGSKKPNKLGRDIFSFYIYSSSFSFCGGAKIYPGKDGLYPGGAHNCGPAHAFFSRKELLSTSLLRGCNKKAGNGGGNRPGVGTACAAVIAIDGWQIKDDYPW